jgi:hypothetical protein
MPAVILGGAACSRLRVRMVGEAEMTTRTSRRSYDLLKTDPGCPGTRQSLWVTVRWET